MSENTRGVVAEPVVELIAWTNIWNRGGMCKSGYQQHPISHGVSDSDELAEFAGRLCYKSWDRPNPLTRSNDGYLANIIRQKHFSVLQHASATFYLKGISRGLTHELVRHRHMAYSQVSQRYVDESHGDFVVHPVLRQYLTENVPDFDDVTFFDAFEGINNHLREAYEELYDFLIKKGHDKKTARGAARSVLPNMTETEIVVSGNLGAWREIIEKRTTGHADQEIEEAVKKIALQLYEIAPNTFRDILIAGGIT